MPYDLHDKHYRNVLDQSAQERAGYFIRKVADWKELWGARREDGWLVPKAPEGMEYFPVWPHPIFAQRIVDVNFPGHRVERLALEEFLQSLLPAMEEDEVKVGVFPDENWRFWVMEPGDLMQSVTHELTQYE